MTETVLSNAKIVLGDEILTGSVVVRDGLITDISEGESRAGTDCAGDYLCPGLIELHTDNLERHMSPRPGVDWPHNAAIIAHDAELAGVGITTVFDAMRVGSVLSRKARSGRYARGMSREILNLRASGNLRISHFLHLRAEICSETLIEELDEFGTDDRIGIISLMDHTPGQRQFADIARHKEYTCGKYGLSDAEYEDFRLFCAEMQTNYGAAHEAAGVAAAARFGAVLASHDDTTVAHVETSAAHGIKLAEFPTTTEAATACRDNDILVMMGAPNVIRGKSHSGNVSAGELAETGLLDILSSDYVPSALLAGAVQLGLRQDNLAKGLATVTSAPADAAKLSDRGRIAEGARADLVRFRLIGQTPQVVETWVQGRRVA